MFAAFGLAPKAPTSHNTTSIAESGKILVETPANAQAIALNESQRAELFQQIKEMVLSDPTLAYHISQIQLSNQATTTTTPHVVLAAPTIRK